MSGSLILPPGGAGVLTGPLKTVWNAWQEEPCELPIPARWDLTEYSLPAEGAISGEAIADRISQALDSKPD